MVQVVMLSLDASGSVRKYFPAAPEIPNDGCVLLVPEEFDCEPLGEVRRALLRDNLVQALEDELVDGGQRFVDENPSAVARWLPPDEYGNTFFSIFFTNAPREALRERLAELGVECIDAEVLLIEPAASGKGSHTAGVDDLELD